MFTLNKCAFPSSSEYVELNGAVAESLPIKARLESVPKAILWTRGIRMESLLSRKYDIVFIDYSNDLTKSGVFSASDIRKLKENGARVYISFPVASANILRFYASQFFDRRTGNPTSSIIRSQYADDSFFVAFWTTEWQAVVLEHLNRILEVEPEGILIRDIDFYNYHLSERPNAYDEMFSFISDLVYKIRLSKKRVILETRELDPFVVRMADGILFPYFFTDQNGRRTNYVERISRKLNKLRDKEIFISDPSDFLWQRKEFLTRAKRHGFCPVFRIFAEDADIDINLLNERLMFDVVCNNYRWRSLIGPLSEGISNISFLSGPALLNSALLSFYPPFWPAVAGTSSQFYLFIDDPCSDPPESSLDCAGQDLFLFEQCKIWLGDRLTRYVSRLDETSLICRLRGSGFFALGQPEELEGSRFFVSLPGTKFEQNWFLSPELSSLLNRFTNPIQVSRTSAGIKFTYGNNLVSTVDMTVCAGAVHNMILIRMYFGRISIFLAVGDPFCIKAFGFILSQLDRYVDILNDETITIITASSIETDPDLYYPNESNVSVVPFVETLVF